jgi:hypothetical protein
MKLEIFINAAWLELDYFANDLKLIRERDSENDLIIRTRLDGTFNFKCTEYTTLLPYINTLNTIIARITEYDCAGNSDVYGGFLSLNNEVDFFNKIIRGQFTLVDVYYQVFEGNDINGDTEYDLLNPLTFQNAKLNKFVFFEDAEFGNVISNNGLTITGIIHGFCRILFDNFQVTYSGTGFNNYILINGSDFFKVEDFLQYTPNKFLCSFNKLFNALREQFNIYWYIDSSNKFQLVYRRYHNLSQTVSDDFTSFETAKSQVIKFDDKKPNLVKIDSFEFKEGEDIWKSKYFANAEVLFNVNSKNDKQISTVLNADINKSDSSKINLCRVNPTNIGSFYYSSINKIFNNYNGDIDYLLGDWTKVEFWTTGNPLSQQWIDTEMLYIFNDGSAPQIEEISFDFAFKSYTPAIWEVGDLKFIKPVGIAGTNNSLSQNVVVGHNIIYQMPSWNTGWYKFRFEVKYGQPIASSGNEAIISNFKIRINNQRFVKHIEPQLIDGKKVGNYAMSNENYLKNFFTQMPGASGVLKMQGLANQNVSYTKKQDCYQKIAVKKNDLIADIDFDKLVTTNIGNMTIDKVEREIKSSHNNLLNYELSKRY